MLLAGWVGESELIGNTHDISYRIIRIARLVDI